MFHGCGHDITHGGGHGDQNMRFVFNVYNVYMFGEKLFLIILAHPICLCLGMIVYAVHVSR